MNLMETIRVAISSLLSNRLRSILATLGIMIGIAAVSTLLSVGQSFQKFTQKQFEGLNTNVITVMAQPNFQFGDAPPSEGQLTDGDIEALRKLPNVAEVIPSYTGDGEIYAGNNLAYAQVIGTEANYLHNEEPPVMGRFLSADDLEARSKVAVLSWVLAQNLFDDGRPLGREIVLRGLSFTVVGVLPNKESFFGNNSQVIVPFTTARDRLFPESLASRTKVSEVTIHLHDAQLIAATEQAVVALLRERHKLSPEQSDDFMLQNFRQFAETNNAILVGITAFLGVVGGIALLVGGIGITNIMLVSVTERTKEIGLRKAVGAKRRDILMQFLVEAVVLSVLGGLGGLLISNTLVELGAIAIHTFLRESGLAPFLTLDLNAVMLALIFASIVGVVAGIYPAIRASRLAPIDALRSN